MFILKVKGFYGKGATYKLSVTKTDNEVIIGFAPDAYFKAE